MNQIPFGSTTVSSIGVGCMRMCDAPLAQVEQLIATAIEQGVTLFDHADIYGKGECERIFATACQNLQLNREQYLLQSKCGIVPNTMYDSSKEHILSAVDGSLQRLNTEYLDVLLIHRPDALMEPEEIAQAFDILYESGKVKAFGVSNHTTGQIALLRKYVHVPLIVNQMQFGLCHASMVQSGIEANLMTDGAVDRDGGLLDDCRLHGMTIQAWSPFQYGFFEGSFLGNPKFEKLNTKLELLAKKYEVSPSTIACAWILRHPAKMQVLAGTMSPQHLKEFCDATNICITRQEWYELYCAAGHILP